MTAEATETSPKAAPSCPHQPIHELIPLMAGPMAFATQVRALGEDLREADRCIAEAAFLDTLALRALWDLREHGPQLMLDLPDRLQARADRMATVVAEVASKGLVRVTDDDHIDVTEAGSLLIDALYGPLDARLTDCMRPHSLATLKALQDLVTAWQEAIRGHHGFLASLPVHSLSREASA